MVTSIYIHTDDLIGQHVIPYEFDILRSLPELTDIWTYHGPSKYRYFKHHSDTLLFELLQDWWTLQVHRTSGKFHLGHQYRDYTDEVKLKTAKRLGLTLHPHVELIVCRDLSTINQVIDEYRAIILVKQISDVSVIIINDILYIAGGVLITNTTSRSLKSLFDYRSYKYYIYDKFEINYASKEDWLAELTTYEGHIGFASDYITEQSNNIDEMHQVVSLIHRVLATESIRNQPSLAGLNPVYSLFMPRAGQYSEFTQRIQDVDEVYINKLNQYPKLTKAQFNYLKQVGQQLGVYNNGPISKTQLCRIILNQFKVERDERQRMKALAN